MKSNETKPSSDPLRALLRRGDPAGDGREPSAEEVRLLRARVLDEARASGAGSPKSRRSFRPALAFGWAAVAGFAVLVALAVVPLRRSQLSPGAIAAPVPAGSATEAPRQVHFTTPGGTRIVWVLYPESP